MIKIITKFFKDEKFWRWLANFWTAVLIAITVADFISKDQYRILLGPASIIYAAVLSLYVGTKEFERWYAFYDERHPGEWFVILWTVTTIALFAAAFALGEGYEVSSEMVANYIIVISIYAFTQQSKRLYRAHHKKSI